MKTKRVSKNQCSGECRFYEEYDAGARKQITVEIGSTLLQETPTPKGMKNSDNNATGGAVTRRQK